MRTQEYTSELVVIDCGGCGVTFGMDEGFYNARRRDGKTWFCPNGCCRVYSDTVEKRLRAELKAKEDRLQRVAAERDNARQKAEAEERRVRAYKGHTTRLKRRVQAGRCVRCSAEFPDLADHMATCHPEVSA